ncbi:hypothetical protein [Arthrobacter zhaoguopingii]|uniref:hypothetical protein n=1 Tax=Arthrobacter zhaoguopingii TaxID=2681491 RepID=UPI00135A5A41|nr:hypothetical protein [Arthrobacter zhaoguopingii]
MAQNKTVTGKSLLFFLGLSIVIGVAIGFLQGWQYSFIGLGAGLGPLIGAYFGNKKAAEVDAYRDEWLGKRKARREGRSTEKPTE